MKVSILIVNYNTKSHLQKALESIVLHASTISHEVVVVDNNSTDGSVEHLRPLFPEVRFIESSENVGFAAGNNLGQPHCSGEYLFYLNPDTELTEGALQQLIAHLDTHPEIGLVAPKLVYGNGQLQRSIRPFYSYWSSFFDNRYLPPLIARLPWLQRFVPFVLNHDVSQTVDWVKGAGMLVRKSLADELMGFDEQFWIYGEEIDLCKRIWDAGYSIFYLHSATIIHYEGQSTRQSSVAMFIQNYRSFYILLAKHFPAKLPAYHQRAKTLSSLWMTWNGIMAIFSVKHENALPHYQSLLDWMNDEGKSIVNATKKHNQAA